VTQAAIAAQVHQPLDVHRHFAAQVALDAILAVDQFADLQHVLVRQLVDPPLIGNRQLAADLLRLGRANAKDVTQADRHPLVGRDIYAGNTRHACLSYRPEGPETTDGAPKHPDSPAILATCWRHLRTRQASQLGPAGDADYTSGPSRVNAD
jgi:hypothetical protein